MKRRTAACLFGVGTVASQAGHLLAYQLRFGQVAGQVQSSGAHAYLPSLAKAVLGLAALAVLGGLVIVALARLIGMRAERDSAPPYLRLLAVLFTVQLGAFAVQETAESLVTGAQTSLHLVLVWGTVGQLPVAAVAALALRWLLARVRPALAYLTFRLRSALEPVEGTTDVVMFPVAATVALVAESASANFTRRGPPSF